MKFHTASADETRALAARLAPHLQAGDVVVLVGDLGSGKTTFAQGVDVRAKPLVIGEGVHSTTLLLRQKITKSRGRSVLAAMTREKTQ